MKKYKVYVNGEPFEVIVEEIEGSATPVVTPAKQQAATTQTQNAPAASPPVVEKTEPKSGGEAFEVAAPMPGSVLDISKQGDSVTRGIHC